LPADSIPADVAATAPGAKPAKATKAPKRIRTTTEK